MQGTRKSSTAIQLAAKLNIKVVVGTDQIRDAVRECIEDPLLKIPTHQCWKLIGEKNPGNIVKGYLGQSELIKQAVLASLKLAENRGENMIFEGVHLHPKLYQLANNSNLNFIHFLLCVEDEKLHQANINLKINLRHNREKNWPGYEIDAIAEIQKFLLESSPDNVCLVNSTTPQKNTNRILEKLSCWLN
jgi:2-phosphoglycerate kinase